MMRIMVVVVLCGFLSGCVFFGAAMDDNHLQGYRLEDDGGDGVFAYRTDSIADIFAAAREVLEERGQLDGAWPSSGRIEGRDERSIFTIQTEAKAPDRNEIRIEARPIAGVADRREEARLLGEAILSRLRANRS